MSVIPKSLRRMARIFTLFGKQIPPIHLSLTKFTKEDVYGIREKIPRDSEGNILMRVSINVDGNLIFPEGALAQLYWDSKNKYVDSSEIIETTFEGTPLAKIPSIFDKPVELIDSISFQDFFRYDISGSYSINSQDNLSQLETECKNLFQQHRLYRIQYAYTSTAHPVDGIIIPFKDQLILLTGIYIEPVWSYVSMNVDELFGNLDELEDEEEMLFQEIW